MRICTIIIPMISKDPAAIATMEIVDVDGELSSSSSAGSSVTTSDTVVTSSVETSGRKY